MCDDTRYFRVEGKVYVDREDVIDWLNEDRPEDELDYDYQSDGARATSSYRLKIHSLSGGAQASRCNAALDGSKPV